MKELIGFIGLACIGILFLEDQSKSFLIEGNVQLKSESGVTAPLIGDDVYLVDSIEFKKAEGVAIQKTKEEVTKFENIIKKKMDLCNAIEEFKGKSIEEILARVLIAPLTEPQNKEEYVKLQKSIVDLFAEKVYIERSDLIFNKFFHISYSQKDRTDVEGKFKFNVPTKGTWFIVCTNTDNITISGSTNKVQARSLFWSVQVPMEGFRSSALFGKYRMPFQPLYVEHIELSMNNLFKPSIK